MAKGFTSLTNAADLDSTTVDINTILAVSDEDLIAELERRGFRVVSPQFDDLIWDTMKKWSDEEMMRRNKE